MKKVKKRAASLSKLGAVPLHDFGPFDHNEPGTPIAVRLTPTPVPPVTTTGKLTKGNTATTQYGRDSGDKVNLKPKQNDKSADTKAKGKEDKASSGKSAKNKHKPDMQNSQFDPNGSYTGVPHNRYERPVQDADDL